MDIVMAMNWMNETRGLANIPPAELRTLRLSNFPWLSMLALEERCDDAVNTGRVPLMRFFCLAKQGDEPANVLKTMADSRRQNFAEFSSFPLIAKVNRGSRYSFRACNYIAVRRTMRAVWITFYCNVCAFWLNIRRGFCGITLGEKVFIVRHVRKFRLIKLWNCRLLLSRITERIRYGCARTTETENGKNRETRELPAPHLILYS